MESRSNEELSKAINESETQIKRYIRLTKLIPDILELVDQGKIAMRPAVELSYLNETEQMNLLSAISEADATPSHAQAIKMRQFSQEGKLMPEVIESIMCEAKPNQKPKISFRYDEIKRYIPSGLSVEKTNEYVVKALEYYHRHRHSNLVIFIGNAPFLHRQQNTQLYEQMLIMPLQIIAHTFKLLGRLPLCQSKRCCNLL